MSPAVERGDELSWWENYSGRLEEQRRRQTAEREFDEQRNRWWVLPRTVGSARVTDGILRLNFTDGSRIDIPMAVVSEIVAVVLAGRLAMGLPEEAK